MSFSLRVIHPITALFLLGLGLSACTPTSTSDDAETTADQSEDGLTASLCCSNTQPGRLPIVRYDGSASYALTTPNGDAADVYHPVDRFGRVLHALGVTYPVIVVLQGALTDKAEYASFAGTLARDGFIVVVPNHARSLGPPGTPPALFTEQSVVTDAFAAVTEDGTRADSPIRGSVDSAHLGVVGHSFGGAAALLAVAGTCGVPFCTPGSYVRPSALTAAVVIGTNYTTGDPRVAIPVDTSAAPVAMIQGTLDGRSLPAYGKLTYDELESPKSFIELDGANHFSLTNTNAPTGAVPDANTATITQADAIAKTATWTGLFLRATIHRDPIARSYMKSAGSYDGSVKVRAAL